MPPSSLAPVISGMPPLVHLLLSELLSADTGPELPDNVDPMRFPGGVVEPAPGTPTERLAELLRFANGLDYFHRQLKHPAEKELMVRILAFRVLGHGRVRLPLALDRLRRLIERAEGARTARGTAPVGILGWEADDYDLDTLGYPIRVRAYVAGVVQTFLLEQYRCPGLPEIAPREGDLVIDGGGHWGDTALYFANAVGTQGRVLSFEFEPSNLAVLHHNLHINPLLSGRVLVIPAALWDRAGGQVSVHPFGPATSIREGGAARAATDTIDAVVARGDAKRVDFIKLDVEGAELNALHGAEATLRRFRPRLAVAAYHKAGDLAEIPRYLTGLGLDYDFRLGHFTMHGEETVLFAIPRS